MSRLRVGLLLGSDGLRVWHEEIITTLVQHPHIDFAGVVETSVGTRRRADRRRSRGALWDWLDRLESFISHRLVRTRQADAPLATGLASGLSTLGNADGLDILILLEGTIADGRAKGMAGDAVWALTFDGRREAFDQVGLRGWFEGQDVIEVTLVRSDPSSDRPVPIERAHYGVFKPSWSVNRSYLLWRIALLISDNVSRFASSDAVLPPVYAARSSLPKAFGPIRGGKTASLPSSLRFAIRYAQRVTRYIWNKLLFKKQWQILTTTSGDKVFDPASYARLEPPADRFWADPFAVSRGDKDYIFVEELRYKKNRGEIAVLEHRDGKLLDARTIISEPYHMSYPHIVDHEGELYMVPETRQKGSIDIWRNTAFPDRWSPIGSLMENVSAVDTTLFRHDGRWWMFTNLSRTLHMPSADELHAFYSDDPSPVTRNWIAHRLNPLVRDTRTSRQGGRVFVDEQERLIRCAQDTAVRYGYAVLFFHVQDLTPVSFAETLLHKALPNWHEEVVGMHTFERCGELRIFDACFAKSRLSLLL